MDLGSAALQSCPWEGCNHRAVDLLLERHMQACPHRPHVEASEEQHSLAPPTLYSADDGTDGQYRKPEGGYSKLPPSSHPPPVLEMNTISSSGPRVLSHADKADTRYESACRNCHEDDSQEDLIAPCACDGSMLWVHRKCLDEWRSVSPNKESFYRCDVCHQEYVLDSKPTVGCPRLRVALRVLRDVILLLLVFQIVVLAIYGCLMLFDSDGVEYEIPAAEEGGEPEVIRFDTAAQLYALAYLLFFFILGMFSIFCCLGATCAWICGGVGDRPEYRYSYNSYPYHRPFFFYYWDILFIDSWCHTCCRPHTHGRPPPPGNCGSPGNCGGGPSCAGCPSGGGGGGNDGLAYLVLIIVVVIIIIGVIAAVCFLIAFTIVMSRRHWERLMRKEGTFVQVVRDLATSPVQEEV